MLIPTPSPTRTRLDYAVIGVLLLVAALLRFHNALTVEVDHPLRADAGEYLAIAYNLAEHGVYSSRFAQAPQTHVGRTPGYPLLLVPVVMLSSNATDLVRYPRLLNAGFGTLTVWLSYLLLRALTPLWVAAPGGFAVALNPHLVSLESYILTESAFALFLVGGIYLLARAFRQRRWWLAVAAGAVLGYAALIRPSFLLFVPFLLPFLWLIKEATASWRKSCSLGLLLGFAISCAPWLAFTAAKGLGPTGTFNGAVTFAAGIYPGHIYQDPRYYGYPYRDPAAPDIHSNYRAAVAQLAAWARADPARYLRWYLIGKPLSLWQWDIIQGQGDVFVYPVKASLFLDKATYVALKQVYRTLHQPFVVAMLCGVLAVLWRLRQPSLVVAAAAVVYLTLIQMVFVPYPRYSIPLRPEMYLLAFAALYLCGNAVLRRASRRLPDPTSDPARLR